MSKGGVRIMVLNTTFNSISVLFVEETRVPAENKQAPASHGHTLLHNVTSNTPHHELDSKSHL
jgi:hypothetical protein